MKEEVCFSVRAEYQDGSAVRWDDILEVRRDGDLFELIEVPWKRTDPCVLDDEVCTVEVGHYISVNACKYVTIQQETCTKKDGSE